jgi:hypothetical protein
LLSFSKIATRHRCKYVNSSITKCTRNYLGAGEGGTPFTDIPYIRGYSSQSSIYVDGVRNATLQNRDMFAIEQVEVTKGSSSTLSGGGGVGGSINLLPNKRIKVMFIKALLQQVQTTIVRYNLMPIKILEMVLLAVSWSWDIKMKSLVKVMVQNTIVLVLHQASHGAWVQPLADH